MKIVICLVAIISLAITVKGQDQENCNCWRGYQARKMADGDVQCLGLLLLHAMPCNVVQAPGCACSGDVNGILTDDTGTWCSVHSRGVELKRWPCENQEEWGEFYRNHPEKIPDQQNML